MRRIMVAGLVAVLVGGCALPVEKTGEAVGEGLDQVEETAIAAGQQSDRLLHRMVTWLCSKRFSQRAYEQAFPGEQWDHLVALCQWDEAPRRTDPDGDPDT